MIYILKIIIPCTQLTKKKEAKNRRQSTFKYYTYHMIIKYNVLFMHTLRSIMKFARTFSLQYHIKYDTQRIMPLLFFTFAIHP
jgi:hypothetical protein